MLPFDIPIGLFIYNRPNYTGRVFDAIRGISPKRLIVVADGAKNPEDARNCELARSLTERVDWPCDVRRFYSDANLGCKRRVSTGLAEVFDLHEQAIILEDDCVPHPTFFPYAAELLDRYRYDERITTISGDCFLKPRTPHSYAFTRFPLIWGWATWRRAWRQYDLSMRSWTAIRQTGWPAEILGSRAAALFFRPMLDGVADGLVDTWDTQWLYSSWLHNGYAIVPARNLITNIGSGRDATHTMNPSDLMELPTEPIDSQLIHPDDVSVDPALERRLMRMVYHFSYYRLSRNMVRSHLPKSLQTLVDRLMQRLRRARHMQRLNSVQPYRSSDNPE